MDEKENVVIKVYKSPLHSTSSLYKSPVSHVLPFFGP